MDKKELLNSNLARIMVGYLPQINELVQRHPKAPVNLKLDGTVVTELDLELSRLMERMAEEHFPGVNFYSEENYSQWKFPKVVVDPLDGTREYIMGRDEWALSVAYFLNENFEGEGVVYNPKTQELYMGEMAKVPFHEKEHYRGEVSRSEWEKGLYRDVPHGKFEIKPKGSIAYKLGRLSSGKLDFVVSLKPKNIWDIAGGTLLCKQAGFKFYSEGKEVNKVHPTYAPPLIWCQPSLFSELSEIFEHNRKGP